MTVRFWLLVLFAFAASGCDNYPDAGGDSNSAAPTQAGAPTDYRAERLKTVDADVERLLSRLTLAEKVSLVHANSKFTIPAVERLGIHEMTMSDGPHGVRYEIARDSWEPAWHTDDQVTYLPTLTMVAASWNPEMARLHGDVLGSEARQRGKDVILGPGVNLARLPLYGRNFEYLGEDPFLAARLVVPEIEAIQANDVSATVKHFALNTQELNRHGVDARPDERTLREVYLPAFEAAVKQAGVHAVMGAYNKFFGTNANQSKTLVSDILKGEWGFDGILMTDWGVDINTYDAAMNGLDIEMGTNADSYDDYFFGKPLREMVEQGKVPESVLDDKVRRILRVQLTIGMMDKHRLSGTRNTEEHQRAVRTIASEGVVLLKNDGLLPFNRSTVKKILVMGPNAAKKQALSGGSSEVPALYEITPLQGLRNKAGDNIEITVMRARQEGELLPIPAEYVTSHHWEGIPAWFVKFYSEKARQRQVGFMMAPGPAHRVNTKWGPAHLTMTGAVSPNQNGEHTLIVEAAGEFKLNVDGETVMQGDSVDSAEYRRKISLEAGREYALELEYDGLGHFTLGWEAPDDIFRSDAEYLAAAREADAVIYVGGLDHDYDREGHDRDNMKLPYHQDEVIAKLLEANKKTVVLLVAGSAVEMPWADQAGAIVWGWYGGMEAGNVFADVLFGDINPSGKMPITLPRALEDTAPIALNDHGPDVNRYPEGVFIGYRWFERQGLEPLFPFGHGLSYTRFTYSDLQIKPGEANGSWTVTATITNSGDRAGAEVAQLYLRDLEASVERPAKELRGFEKVFLEPGASRTVTLHLNERDLSFWDVNSHGWLAEPGEFEVMLGASVEDIRLRERFTYRPSPEGGSGGQAL